MKIVREQPHAGRCLKQTVTATIVTAVGTRYVATNGIAVAQTACPRAELPTGVGYELCRDVCKQSGHAEVNAVKLAGKAAEGAILYVEGHTYACDSCQAAAKAAGIAEIVIGAPPISPVRGEVN